MVSGNGVDSWDREIGHQIISHFHLSCQARNKASTLQKHDEKLHHKNGRLQENPWLTFEKNCGPLLISEQES